MIQDRIREILQNFNPEEEDYMPISEDDALNCLIQVSKSYIEEKSSKSKTIGRLAFTQELLDGLKKENV